MKPGLYRLTRAEYDAAPGIRNTELGWAARSMRHYAYYKQSPPESTPAKRAGQLIHRAILEPDWFAASTIAIPFDAPKRPTKAQINAKKPSDEARVAIQWWAKFDKDNVGKEQLGAEERAEIANMVDAVWSDRDASEILRHSRRKELAVFSRHESTGLLLKSSIDILTDDDSEVWDLKTTVDGEPDAYRRAVTNFGYHRQGDFYTGHFPRLGIKRPAFGHIVLEKEPPYIVSVRPFDDESLEIGRKEVSALLRNIAACKAAKIYPGYHTGRDHTGLTHWRIREALG